MPSRSIVTRRSLLAASAGLFALAGCSQSEPTGGADKITWRDHLMAPRPLSMEMFEAFTSSAGMQVEYSDYDAPGLGQALQLAKQSGQMPDVFALGGLELPAATLFEQGWFAALPLSDASVDLLPEEAKLPGITAFDGAQYSLPIFSARDGNAYTWYLSSTVEEAGLDPDSPPETYDEFRQACRAVVQSSGGSVQGWMAKLGAIDHMGSNINNLVQAAGFQGANGLDYRTGEFSFASDPYLTVLEFLLSLKQDQLMLPGSVQLKDSPAITRWAAGEAAFHINDSHVAGVVKNQAEEVAGELRVGNVLVPDKGTPPQMYCNATGGMFWLSQESENQDAVGQLLDTFCTEDYFVRLAAMMGRPPLLLDAVKSAEVLPAYAQAQDWNAQQVHLGPIPSVRNPAVVTVSSQTRPVQPDFGDIVEGLFSGQITDARRALTELDSALSTERDRAIEAAAQKGAVASVEDWSFIDWQPGADYTTQTG
ncbi:ABC transporter substrate-binding protein [Ruania zhangjianzhongii]|uniref:ABC transporter substrate-binding protein n=1 Tax=Ruania zhangjianzhongii TaxID=2603206 RepID=UPI0011CB59D5|nr:ABC transporter substrate-binding protein [Ruania zhangjianzhongii]